MNCPDRLIGIPPSPICLLKPVNLCVLFALCLPGISLSGRYLLTSWIMSLPFNLQCVTTLTVSNYVYSSDSQLPFLEPDPTKVTIPGIIVVTFLCTLSNRKAFSIAQLHPFTMYTST